MEIHTRRRVVLIHSATHHHPRHHARGALLLSACQIFIERDAPWKLTEKLVESRMDVQNQNGFWNSVDKIDQFESGALRQERPNLVTQGKAITEKISLQVMFRIHIVNLGVHHQRIDQISTVILDVVAPRLLHEPREHARGVQDLLRPISGDLLPVVDHRTAVRLQLLNTYGKQLHDLPCKVLVGERTAVIVRSTVSVRQISSHDGTERHLLQDIAKIEEGMPHKDVVVRQIHFIQIRIDSHITHDEDLRQSPRCALA
mmetsp:Transcript_38978/g.103585  ORF Transcript_38978/g.103585 Transcript_38978/m.103585 type:complete len:258 (-) Transcript_38978:90-863(-)